jgi:hypothetical protein
MSDRENLDSVLHDRHAVGVVGRYDVGDISMDKQFARRKADDLIRRDSAIGATDPQIIRRLDLAKTFEKLRIAPGLFPGPFAVVGKKIVESRH